MVASASAPELGSPPIPRTPLIGREAERATARTLLLDAAVPLLTLTGPGGAGKTRLAQAIAQDVAAHFADGVVWVDLAPLVDPRLVVPAIAHALGLRRRFRACSAAASLPGPTFRPSRRLTFDGSEPASRPC